MKVVLYGKNNCGLCDDAKSILQELSKKFTFELEEVDIYTSELLVEKYHVMIPVVEINGEEVEFGRIHKDVISKRLIESSWVE